jgi:hypothetical protein
MLLQYSLEYFFQITPKCFCAIKRAEVNFGVQHGAPKSYAHRRLIHTLVAGMFISWRQEEDYEYDYEADYERDYDGCSRNWGF